MNRGLKKKEELLEFEQVSSAYIFVLLIQTVFVS